MTIRAKLYTAIVVVVVGLALTVGVGLWAMSRLGDRFDQVQRSADARALALQLKFDVTDFNGWQTAYGYDGGKSRPTYLAAYARFRSNLSRARTTLTRAEDQRVLDRIEDSTDDFARLDKRAWGALQVGRADEVRRLLLGPEIENFRRAAAAAEELAGLERAHAAAHERAFRGARADAVRLLIGASIVAAFLVVVLLVTASDLARRAESTLETTQDVARPDS